MMGIKVMLISAILFVMGMLLVGTVQEEVKVLNPLAVQFVEMAS